MFLKKKMNENNSLLYIEKTLENEYSMINDDYNMLNEIYSDDIKEIKNNDEELYFLLKLKHQIEIQQSTIDLLETMKLDDLLDNKEDNYMYLPYWIKIFYSKDKKTLKIYVFVFWFKHEDKIKEELNEALSKDIDEPIFYNIIDETKNIIDSSLTDKQILTDILEEIRDLMALKIPTNTDNFLLFETGANEDIEDFVYKDEKLKNKSESHENNKKEHLINLNTNKTLEKKKENDDNNEYNYDKFLKDKGFAGETIIDRASTFQAHAIKIKNKKEAEFYKKCLLSQKKIKKATHNITIYRFINKETEQIVEDYNDDGEDGAGYRLLGIVQKMKLVNLFVMVSRWFGGTLLHQDRFKRINDSAKNLLNSHLDAFETCK